MEHKNETLAKLLSNLDLGASVAESDSLLDSARVETSTFSDLLTGRIDLVPGTKGSGKSALFRLTTEYLPGDLLRSRRVVVAHGVKTTGDVIFAAYRQQFDSLSEEDFVDFWCLYLVSLARDNFIGNPDFKKELRDCDNEIALFRDACTHANIPEFETRSTLQRVLDWVFGALKKIRPKVSAAANPATGEISGQITLFEEPTQPEAAPTQTTAAALPRFMQRLQVALEAVLEKSDLNLWLMVDRLDELFLRRSETERKSLRALLRTMRMFTSQRMSLKIFLRDDILEEITRGGEGFTALTHVTAKSADALSWSQDQILTLIVNRFFANDDLCRYLNIDRAKIAASSDYRREAFYTVFPPQVSRGERQSDTLSWLYRHAMDGRGVVTPRDIIDLLTRAKQWQETDCLANPDGKAPSLLGRSALKHGLKELSKRKKETYLYAEFPHFQDAIRKFENGKSGYSVAAIRSLLGKGSDDTIRALCAVGFLKKVQRASEDAYEVPFLYRHGLNIKQGFAN